MKNFRALYFSWIVAMFAAIGMSTVVMRGEAATGVHELTSFSSFTLPTTAVEGQSAQIEPNAYASRTAADGSDSENLVPDLNATALRHVTDGDISVTAVENAPKGTEATATDLVRTNGVVQNRYYTSFQQAATNSNYTTVIKFENNFATDDSTFTFYYDNVGTYVDATNTKQAMGAYVTLSNIQYTAGVSGGSGNNVVPFIAMTNSLYSGIYYNKIKSVDVSITYVDADSENFIDVQNNEYNKSYLTFASLNAHPNSAGQTGPTRGSEWVTWFGQHTDAADNQGILATDTAVSQTGDSANPNYTYYGSDTDWEGTNYADDRIGATRFSESGVSFTLGFSDAEAKVWESANFAVGSETDGVWQPFLSYSVNDISNIPAKFSPDPSKRITTSNKPDYKNELDNALLPAGTSDFWYWLYVPTYELVTNNKPNRISVSDVLPGDTELGAADQVVFNTTSGRVDADAVVVQYRDADGDWQVMPRQQGRTTYYDVRENGRYGVTVELTTNGVDLLTFDTPIVTGGDVATAGRLAVGLNVKQAEAAKPDASKGEYINSADVTFRYGTGTLTGTTNDVVHYRGGWFDFGINKVMKNGTPLAGAAFTLTDNFGNVITPTEADAPTGLFRWESLIPGVYTLKETKAPDGYDLDKREYTLRVSSDYKATLSPAATSLTEVSSTTVDYVTDTHASVIYAFANQHEPHEEPSVDVVKVDHDNSDNLLSGADFRLIRVADLTGDLTDPENVLETFDMAEAATGHYPALRLNDGHYVLMEVSAPAGYVVNDLKYAFEITGSEIGVSDLTTNPNGLVALPTTWITDDPEIENIGGDDVEQHHYSFTFPNDKKSVFPLVGSVGTWLFGAMAGSLIVLAAAIWVLRRYLVKKGH
jgi:hypothetical protein